MFIDSGSTSHMTPWREGLTSVGEINQTGTFGDKGELKVQAVGQMRLTIPGQESRTPFDY